MSENKEYMYFAFISYSRRDEDFAERIQKTLEHYNLPSRLHRKYDKLPTSVRPIFRDRTDLGVGGLNEGLNRALNSSKYLVVICSENSARPNSKGKRYIDMEVQNFIALAPEKNLQRVIPILYRPDKNVPRERCIPPAVQELNMELKESDVIGEQRIVVEAIAKMLGINEKTLWEEWLISERRRRLIWRGIASFLLLIVAVVSYLFYDYNNVKTHYSADYNSALSTYTSISREDAQRLPSVTRIVEQYWKTQETMICYGDGTPMLIDPLDFLHLSSYTKFVYNSDGEIDQRAEYDKHMRVLSAIEHIESQEASIICIPELPFEILPDLYKYVPLTHDAEVECPEEASSVVYSKNDRGYITELCYKDAVGRVVSTSQGWKVKKLTYDAAGNVTQIVFANEKGESINTEDGVSSICFTYDDGGYLSHISYKNSAGHSCVNTSLGWAEAHIGRDSMGRVTAIRYYDSEGSTCRDLKEGVAVISLSYDEHNKPVRICFADEMNQPIAHRIFGGSVIELAYNDSGVLAQASFKNADGTPSISDELGCASLHYSFDASGRLLSLKGFDKESNPAIILPCGAERVDFDYDDAQRLSCISFYDVEQNHTLSGILGVSSIHYKYAHDGKLNSVSFVDEKGQPVKCSNGYAECRIEWNKRPIRYEFADELGKPCNTVMGYSQIRLKYDEGGKKQTVECVDVKGQIVPEDRQKKEITDIPIPERINRQTLRRAEAQEKVSKLNRVNRRGQIVETLFSDRDGKLVATYENGIYGISNLYGDDFSLSCSTYYYLDGTYKTLKKNPDATSEIATYDSNGKLVGKVVANQEGRALISATYEYDAEGNPVKEIAAGTERYFDTQGRLIKLVGDSNFSTANTSLHEVLASSRYAGKTIEYTYFNDSSKQPRTIRTISDNSCIEMATYSEDGNICTTEVYNTDGVLLNVFELHKGRFPDISLNTNEKGNLEEMTKSKDGTEAVSEIKALDLHGNPIDINEMKKRIAEIEKNGRSGLPPMPDVDPDEDRGFSRLITDKKENKFSLYRTDGSYAEIRELPYQEAEYRLYSPEKVLLIARKWIGDEFTEWRYTPTETQEIHYCGYTPGGPIPSVCGEGYHIRLTTHGGNTERTLYYNERKQPCINIYGFHGSKREFDDRGRLIRETYYDVQGHPCRRSGGYAEKRLEYTNNQENIQYFDLNGKEILPKTAH